MPGLERPDADRLSSTKADADDCHLELERAQGQIQSLIDRLDHERWLERQRLAADLHDDLSQVLVALHLEADLLRQRFDGGHRTDRLSQLASLALQASRRAFANLRPPNLDRGLVPGLRWLAKGFRDRTGRACSVMADKGHAPEGAVALELFRIAQEALNNVERHAGASKTWVRLNHQAGGWELVIHDNGCGFDVAQSVGRQQFGMMGMRERAVRLGADLQVDSALGQGTTVRVRRSASQLAIWPDGTDT